MNSSDLSVVICGEAGQGIQTVEHFLTRVLKHAGYNVFATKEYMSRIRGGSNSTEIRISSRRVYAFLDRIDIFIPLDKDAVSHLRHRLSSETLILMDAEKIGTQVDVEGYRVVNVPFSRLAAEAGGPIYANTVAVGVLAGMLGIEAGIPEWYIKDRFSSKGEDVVGKNMQALGKGMETGSGLAASSGLNLDITKDSQISDEIILAGIEAVSMGALAGGCDFIASYPMSPSTGVLTFLAEHAADFGVVVEQAEDEISAVNMALGAWYAGARAMVTTAGGGFALMEEGVSLAGMIESPLVIHLGQRPGPATGLPTRSEQGDLELALYSGHGEFPRIILAPGTIEDAFYLTRRAFYLADKHQVPVFIMTDQSLADAFYNMAPFDLSGFEVERHIVETDKDYRRYVITPDGLSPRGIPGYGDGLVVLDSDEHDEEGHITEDLDLRTRMVDKRLAGMKGIEAEIIPPELIGPAGYSNLIVCWGSTINAVREAMERMGRDDLAALYFKQVHPLHQDTAGYLAKAGKIINIESNATAQFARLLKIHTGLDIEDKILKYNGLPFSVEEIEEKLSGILSM
ncbi:MAG: 2-oxoacid:acceptor oxidoreductase subunit alpha [bacterium]|nr:2-oxoacid:acceptor oxidoreductase subunit alpha [bacterium]